MVLRAPGAFSTVATLYLPRDPVAHDLAGAEGHHAARRDWHFDAGLRIAADALTLVAQDEGAEAGDLHVRAVSQRVAHVMEHALDQARAFRARQAQLAVHDVGQIGARQSVPRLCFIIDPRDPEIGHDIISRPYSTRPHVDSPS